MKETPKSDQATVLDLRMNTVNAFPFHEMYAYVTFKANYLPFMLPTDYLDHSNIYPGLLDESAILIKITFYLDMTYPSPSNSEFLLYSLHCFSDLHIYIHIFYIIYFSLQYGW